MILVDSNIFFDIFNADPTWLDWSKAELNKALDGDGASINPLIYAEILRNFDDPNELHAILPPALVWLDLPYDAAGPANRAFAAYRGRGGNKTSPLVNGANDQLVPEAYDEGVSWKAAITLTGPDPTDPVRGTRGVDAGFAQTLKVNELRAIYGNNGNIGSKGVPDIQIGATYRDSIINNEPPYYDSSNNSVFTDRPPNERSGIISSQDRPYLSGIPKYFNSQQINNAARVSRIDVDWEFDLRIIAVANGEIRMRNGLPPHSGHAKIGWKWNPSLDIAWGNQQSPTFSPDLPQTSLAFANSANKVAWESVDDGAVGLFNIDPNQTFNTFVNNFQWGNQ